jgi:hypothetical protein
MSSYKNSILAILVGVLVTACGDTPNEVSCAPTEQGITPVCGFLGPEDLEPIPGKEALLVSGFTMYDAEANGDIRVLDLTNNTNYPVFDETMLGRGTPPEEGWGSATCPGSPEKFAAHGLHLSQNDKGTLTLLAVNHTSREAIEWFEIWEEESRFKAEWRGCVVADNGLWLNDVVKMPGDGFVATHMIGKDQSATLIDIEPNSSIKTGFVVEWSNNQGWRQIPGTEGSLPNGIQSSPDGKILYVSHYTGNQVVAVEKESGTRLWTVKVNGAPDNLSITPDEQLLVATHQVPLKAIFEECAQQAIEFCPLRFAVQKIDILSGDVHTIHESEDSPFGGATVAVQVKDDIFMGSFAGKRIGKIRASAETK